MTKLTLVATKLAGPAGLGLIVGGIWGLGGWEWAAIAAGSPVAAFYLYGEIMQVRYGSRQRGSD